MTWTITPEPYNPPVAAALWRGYCTGLSTPAKAPP